MRESRIASGCLAFIPKYCSSIGENFVTDVALVAPSTSGLRESLDAAEHAPGTAPNVRALQLDVEPRGLRVRRRAVAFGGDDRHVVDRLGSEPARVFLGIADDQSPHGAPNFAIVVGPGDRILRRHQTREPFECDGSRNLLPAGRGRSTPYRVNERESIGKDAARNVG